MPSMSYLPFRGLSAWFSCSVNPKVIKNWDHYGGTYAGENTADYLFSDDALTKDTRRVYETQQGVVLFQSSWIMDVIQRRCQVHDIVGGQHLLCPHYLAPMETGCSAPDHVTVTRMTSRNGRDVLKRSTAKSYQLNGEASLHAKGSVAVDKSTERELLIHNSINKEPVSSSAASQGDADELWGRLEKKASRSKTSESVHLDQVYGFGQKALEIMYDFDHSKPVFRIERIK